MEVRFNGDREMESFTVGNGSELATAGVSPRRALQGGAADPSLINVRPYQMIAEELMANYTPAFLVGLQASFSESPNGTAPVIFGDCGTESVLCGVALVAYGLTIVSLLSCTVLLPSCIAGILGHEIAAGSAAYACIDWSVCLDNCEEGG